MRKIEALGTILIIIVSVSLLNLYLEADFGDYIQYSKNREAYQIEVVKVEEVKSRYRMHSDVGVFHYYDNTGNYIQGRTYLNYNENQGDYIEVAFDEYRGYIRPIVTVADGGYIDYIFALIFLIYLIKVIIDELKRCNWDKRL